MKKLMSVILIFVLLFAVAACAKQGDDDGEKTSGKTTAEQSLEAGGSTALDWQGDSTTVLNKGSEPVTTITTIPTSVRATAKQTTLPTTNTTTVRTTRPTTQVRSTTVATTANTPAAGGVLSSFSAKDLNGNTVDQSVFSGKKLTMVNVWATFCGPCINEMPALAALNNSYASQGFQVVGIVSDAQSDSGIAQAKSILSSAGATYKNILPSPSLNSALLHSVEYVPTTVFVDENGAMVGQLYVGSKSEKEWADIIDSLLTQV